MVVWKSLWMLRWSALKEWRLLLELPLVLVME